MDRYVLSRETEDDIEAIYNFGVQKFGKEQSLQYLKGLRSSFRSLLKNPFIGRKCDEIKGGLFSFPTSPTTANINSDFKGL